MGKAQRDKGHRFERQVAADATVALGKKVTRTIQFRGGESEGSDVVVEPFAIECKAYKKVGGLINRAYEQAKRDAKEGFIPICICKGDRQEPLVTMGYSDFWELIREWRERGEGYDAPYDAATVREFEKLFAVAVDREIKKKEDEFKQRSITHNDDSI